MVLNVLLCYAVRVEGRKEALGIRHSSMEWETGGRELRLRDADVSVENSLGFNLGGTHSHFCYRRSNGRGAVIAVLNNFRCNLRFILQFTNLFVALSVETWGPPPLRFPNFIPCIIPIRLTHPNIYIYNIAKISIFILYIHFQFYFYLFMF